jgi:hypothetical protein
VRARSGLGGAGAPAPGPRDVALSFSHGAADPAYACVEVHGFDPGEIAELRRRGLSQAQWRDRFGVVVKDRLKPGRGRSATPILAHYELLDDRVRLTPEYPWEPGLEYSAYADLVQLLPDRRSPGSIELTFGLKRAPRGPATVVQSLYPSGEVLPENLLRFYVHFSGPMQRGQARDQIALLGQDDQPVEDALYRAPVELWDPAMRRLTVLLDPGRLKRGVGPNAQLGPPLQTGQRYTLVIGGGMIDATGRPLGETQAKKFRVVEPVRAPVDPALWTISPPPRGTRTAMRVAFPAPLDRALLARGIWIERDRQRVAGQAAIDREETGWTFTPSTAWKVGLYQVRIDPLLEDVCGNNVLAPFDGFRARNAVERTGQATVSLGVRL